MVHLMKAALASLALSVAALAFSTHAEGTSDMQNSILVIHEKGATTVERNAVDAFARRLRLRSHADVTVAADAEARSMPQADAARYGFVVLAGVAEDAQSEALKDYDAAPPEKAEGYSIDIGDNRGWTAETFSAANRLAIVCGRDSRGMLFGLGKLLRLAEFTEPGLSLAPQKLTESPAIAQRGVYFATHFNNYYETAPVEEIEAYIEDMAFWGLNAVWTWFDMNWYPEGFWEDPQSKGMEILRRIRRAYDKARSLGLTVGLTAIANEGFKAQPPKELLADMSEKRGGYYPESTICPSKPGGMEMILKNRRKVLELIGPIDAYVTWPFDQGSCGCDQCRPWVRTFMKINPEIVKEVRQQNPNAKILLSTWMFTEDEMQIAQAAMEQGASWFEGVVVESKWTDTFAPPARYERMVFPEISMEGSLFCGYGASGANPMPTKFVDEARSAAAHGYGSMLYSEGIYEDLNKVVWACTLWNPQRTPEDIVAEYARFYFGPVKAGDWSTLILGLEKTWPPEALPQKDPAEVQRLFELAEALGQALPDADTSQTRWRYFRDRAEMDWRMVQIGGDEKLLRAAKAVLTDSGYTSDLETLRRDIQQLRAKVAARADAVTALFQLHWEYLRHAHLDRSTGLILTPPTFVGQRDWDRLTALLDRALQNPDGEAMRTAVLKAFKEWCWYNNVTFEYIFL